MKRNHKILQYNFFTLKKQSLEHFLKKHYYGDKYINKLIKENKIVINGKVVDSKYYQIKPIINKIMVTLTNEFSTLPIYNDKLDIIYEDEYILIVNKPKDMDIEPTKRNYNDNLATRINYYFKNNKIDSKIHFVNRLDKITSGLVMVAKNQYLHNLFIHQKIIKKYMAIVSGKTPKRGTIKIQIKDDDTLHKRIIDSNGKLAISKYQRISFDGTNSLVKIKLITGRTHQIRLSFASINHPLVGDNLYNDDINEKEPFLMAYFLKFYHPIFHKKMKIVIKKK